MEQKTFKFRIKEIVVGCCDVVMTINGKVIPYNASYLGPEPLASMIEICADMTQQNDREYRTSWEDEPGELKFTFIPKKNGALHIDIVDKITNEEWHEDIPFDAFVSAIVSEGFRVLNAFGLFGYREAWSDGMEFPISALLLTCGLYNKNNWPYKRFTSDFSEETDYLKQHVMDGCMDAETVMDECTLYYDKWQMRYCGEPFSVGDRISLTCSAPLRPFTAHGTICDFYKDHHHDPTHRIVGTVSRILSEQSDTPIDDDELLYEKTWTDKREVTCADGTEEKSEDDNKRRTLWGYIVELDNATITPLRDDIR